MNSLKTKQIAFSIAAAVITLAIRPTMVKAASPPEVSEITKMFNGLESLDLIGLSELQKAVNRLPNGTKLTITGKPPSRDKQIQKAIARVTDHIGTVSTLQQLNINPIISGLELRTLRAQLDQLKSGNISNSVRSDFDLPVREQTVEITVLNGKTYGSWEKLLGMQPQSIDINEKAGVGLTVALRSSFDNLRLKAAGAVPEKIRAMKLGPKSGGTIIFGVGAAAGFYAGKTLAGEANADAKALRDLDQPSGTSEGRGDRASNTNAWATQPVAQRQRVSH